MDIQALGMLSNITAIVQKQNMNTIENDINVEKDFCGTLREQQINCVKEDIYNKFHEWLVYPPFAERHELGD